MRNEPCDRHGECAGVHMGDEGDQAADRTDVAVDTDRTPRTPERVAGRYTPDPWELGHGD